MWPALKGYRLIARWPGHELPAFILALRLVPHPSRGSLRLGWEGTSVRPPLFALPLGTEPVAMLRFRLPETFQAARLEPTLARRRPLIANSAMNGAQIRVSQFTVRACPGHLPHRKQRDERAQINNPQCALYACPGHLPGQLMPPAIDTPARGTNFPIPAY